MDFIHGDIPDLSSKQIPHPKKMHRYTAMLLTVYELEGVQFTYEYKNNN